MPVFDLEADSLNPTKIHVISYMDDDGKPVSLTSYGAMKKWLLAQEVLIGHNCILFDIPVIERLLDIKIEAKLIDTLALSWYLFDRQRILHGLDSWGDDVGISKPKVTDWSTQPLSVYVNRCEEDVKINQKVWEIEQAYLAKLYNVSKDKVEDLPIIDYLSFKLDCVREQERCGWLVNIPEAKKLLDVLMKEKDEKFEALKAVMPKVIKTRMKPYPAKPFKKDGTFSVEGAKWQILLKEKGLPEEYTDDIEVVIGEEEPSPSSVQVKKWFFSLGWVPQTFKENAKGEMVPQIKIPNSTDLCPSVIALIEEHPDLAPYEGYTTLVHRVSFVEGLLENADEEGYIYPSISGFTNTLRFKHKVFVNAPGADKPWGKEIRSLMIAREGYEHCGSDMVSLEATTKKHYMFPHDPAYVADMSVPGFDEHLDVAVFAGEITREQYFDHIEKRVLIPKVRKKFKPVNYSGVYGIGKVKLARELKITERAAKALLDAYWKRNWAVKKVAAEQITKTIDGQMWLLNPVSKFWYSLRNEKDIFSTLNQGTGVFCFDSWVREFRKKRSQINMQMHDEVVLEIKLGFREQCTKLLKDAIQRVNNKLNLNVPLDVDVQFGPNYGSIH